MILWSRSRGRPSHLEVIMSFYICGLQYLVTVLFVIFVHGMLASRLIISIKLVHEILQNGLKYMLNQWVFILRLVQASSDINIINHIDAILTYHVKRYQCWNT